MAGYEGFVDLKYKPSEDDLVATFTIEPAPKIPMKTAAGAVAGESSVGTWTELTTMRAHIDKIKARCFEIKGKRIRVAYPSILFEAGNMPQIWSSIAGNIFGMKVVKNIRLETAEWPEKIRNSFRGPKFGIKGVRNIFKVYDRPLTASVPKPKIGMSTSEHAKVAYETWVGGLDLVKDDENLSSQSFNKFENRVRETMKMRDKAEKETGEKKSYLLNITAETNEMLKRAKLAQNYGNEYVMIDILTAGWAGLQTIRNECDDLNLAIHAHRAFHAAFTRNKKHGAAMKFVAETARLCGVDQLHIGTVIGKLESPKEEVFALNKRLKENSFGSRASSDLSLRSRWGKIKDVFPVCSGGLHPGLLPPLIKWLSKDIIIQVGGGVHGHPMGTRAGAKAVRDAVQASVDGESLQEAAKKSNELKVALEKWGYFKGKV